MSILFTTIGQLQLLQWSIREALNTDESLVLKLYTAVSPAISSSSIPANFTEATFTGYSSVTLHRANWLATTYVNSSAFICYNTPVTWTASSSQIILGYYIVGSNSTNLLWIGPFDNPANLSSGDPLIITPQLSLVGV